MKMNTLFSNLFIHVYENCIKFGNFKLSSGKESNYYIDIKNGITLNPRGLLLVTNYIVDNYIKKLKPNLVGGPELGIVPIIGSVLYKCYLDSDINYINGFVVRNGNKNYGTSKLIEGNIRSGQSIIIIDDVVTTGNSINKSIKEIENLGCKIVKIISIVDREEGGKELLKDYDYESIINVSELFQYKEKIKGD